MSGEVAVYDADSLTINNSTALNFLYHKNRFTETGFGSLDYLVMTAVLLISIGLSLSRTLQYRSDVDDVVDDMKPVKPVPKPSPSTVTEVIYQVVASGGSPTSPFVNTLCLFGLAGEVYKNDTRVLFFLVGFLLGIVLLFLLHYFSILSRHNLMSFPAYLKRRFQRKGISTIVAISSIVRQFLGGTLNLCIMCIGVSAMTGISAFYTATFITLAAVTCTSASRIHSGNNSSIGGILIWLVGITTLATLTVTTAKEGGFANLLSEANRLGKFQLPSLYLIPWEEDSLWGFLAIGGVLGFQIFAFSRSTLRHAIELDKGPFFWSLFSTFALIAVWTLIGVWGGLCVSVAFEGTVVLVPDGLMAQLVSKEMHDMKGFRGFFVSTLVASSISGLTRRYNQLIELIWETFHDLCKKEEDQEASVSIFVRKDSRHIPYEYLKELKWQQRKKTCCFQFSFKLIMSLVIGLTSCGMVFVFLYLNLTMWELWQSVVGIFIGPMIAALFIGLFCPCISHMSVCLGLMIGWAIPCYLMIGSKVHDFGQISTGSDLHLLTTPKPLTMAVDTTFLDALNVTHKETVFFIYSDKSVKDQMIKEDKRHTKIAKELEEQSRRKFKRKSSISGKILSTWYCFYGPVGMISCILSCLLFAGVAGKCKWQLNETAADLLHPYIRKKYLSAFTISLERRKSSRRGPVKMDNALTIIQETAHI